MQACLSHGGPTNYTGAEPAGRLMVGTIEGIVVLERREKNGPWSEASRWLQGEHISALMIEPAAGKLFAGTHGDGLYASDDQGRTWQRCDRGIDYVDIYSLSLVQSEEGVRLYAGTEPAHLYVSTDLGETWQELPSLRDVPSVDQWYFPGPPHLAHVKHVAFEPGRPEVIYACIEVGGLLRSEDGGRTWLELSGFHPDVHRLVVPPQHPDRLYMATGDGIYYSSDRGVTWEQLTDRSGRIGYPDALVVHPEHSDLLFMAGAVNSPRHWRTTHTADAHIARSRDGGRTWEVLYRGLPEHLRGNTEAMSMVLWPEGFSLFVATTDGDVFCSEDEGETWSVIASGLPPVSKGGHYKPLREPVVRA